MDTLGLLTQHAQSSGKTSGGKKGVLVCGLMVCGLIAVVVTLLAVMMPGSGGDYEERLQGCVFTHNEQADRFDNQHNFQHNRLYPGQYICSKNFTNSKLEHHRYRFGVSPKGDLVLKDKMDDKKRQVVYKHKGDHEEVYFALQINGTMVMMDAATDQVIWSLDAMKKMHLVPECMPEHDCPFLSMHADGVLVVDYMDEKNEWKESSFKHVYGDEF